MSWTFVSSFVNLDPYQQGNSECRPAKGYLEQSISTLELPVSICVFVSHDMYDIILEKAKHRTHPYKIISIEFEKLKTFAMYPKICQNRSSGKYEPMYRKSRNTPAYSVVNVAKFEFLKMAVELNPFESSMFAWIDFHYGHCDKNFSLDGLKSHVLDIVSYPLKYWPKDKYNLPLISWLPTSCFLDKSQYYRTDSISTTFAGGFNFGPAHMIPRIADAILQEFSETVDQGMGHADEQLYYYVYRKNPSWFDVFPCDYYGMIFNAIYPQRDIDCSLHHLLPSLVRDNQLTLVRSVVSKLLTSHLKGLITLPQSFFNTYCEF